jgi:hypothetical protein
MSGDRRDGGINPKADHISRNSSSSLPCVNKDLGINTLLDMVNKVSDVCTIFTRALLSAKSTSYLVCVTIRSHSNLGSSCVYFTFLPSFTTAHSFILPSSLSLSACCIPGSLLSSVELGRCNRKDSILEPSWK